MERLNTHFIEFSEQLRTYQLPLLEVSYFPVKIPSRTLPILIMKRIRCEKFFATVPVYWAISELSAK